MFPKNFQSPLDKVIFVFFILVGGALGVFGGWVIHFIIEADARFLTQHTWLSGSVGIVALFLLAHIMYESKNRNPRVYGLLVLGIAGEIFLQAISLWSVPTLARPLSPSHSPLA